MITELISGSPIGVFDSGLGGLTVLKSLEKIMPNESFIYFGDTAHVPYGNKSVETIIQYSKNIIDFFLNHNVKAIVIACNTVSSVAFKTLSVNYKISLFDVVHPSVSFANQVSNTRNVGVIGTHATINAKAYTEAFKNINSDCSISEVSCPLLVPIIEEGWANTVVSKNITKIYLDSFNKTNIDTLILGCTHYPIMSNVIKKILNNDIKLVESGIVVANKLLKYLSKNNLKNISSCLLKTKFYVTDYPQKFDELGSRFLGRHLKNITHISPF